MRITPNHFHRLPAPQFLQDMKRCSRLDVPTCPRVPQIMPAEIRDICLSKGFTPCLRVVESDRLTPVRKDPDIMSARKPGLIYLKLFVQYSNDWSIGT